MQKIKEIREKLGMSQKTFAEHFDINVRSLQNWEIGRVKTPIHVIQLVEQRILTENLTKSDYQFRATARLVDKDEKVIGFEFYDTVNRRYIELMDAEIKKAPYRDLVDVKYSGRGFEYKFKGMNKVSDLERKQVHDLGKPNVQDDNTSIEKQFYTNVIIGTALERIINNQDIKKQRFLVKTICTYLNKPANGRILGIYGLRRTGKTVALLQAIEILLNNNRKAAYVLLNQKDTLVNLYKDIEKLIKQGVNYIFIDEITYVDGVLQASNKLSDIYAKMGVHIVIAGTDSFILRLAKANILYDRLDLIHTTYISYQEYVHLFGKSSILNYIRAGGILSENGFADNERAAEYLDSSISTNIINSLRSANNRAFSHLLELDDRGLLRKAIEQTVQSANEELTIRVITKLFKEHELGSSMQKLAGVYDYKQDLNIDNITEMLRYVLGIVDKDNSEFNGDYVRELREYLYKTDVLIEYIRYAGKMSLEVYLFTQPGFRYYQTRQLLQVLKNDVSFRNLDKEYQSLLLTKIIEGVEGDLIEHTVISSCLRFAKSQSNIQVTQFTAINQGEWDMVIMDDEKMDIYEIKRSDTCNENQSKWLTDMEMKQEGERLFGKPIRKRVVLYRGQNSIVTRKGYEIEYLNIDSFLINLDNSLYLT